MNERFAHALGALRREKGVSQRQAARDLGVSQALLSHYENGVREPGLAFVVRACDYYGASADYLLGRTGRPERPGASSEAADSLADALIRAGREDPALGALLRQLARELD
jgi:transcriptional regulator with XRE-family HTH domain